MDFFRLDCRDEDDDGLLDLSSEPYLVVFAADISGATSRVATVRSKVFGSVDTGDIHYSDPVLQVWDFDGTGSPILNPDKLCEIHCPVRGMVGDKDGTVSVEESLAASRSMERGELEVLPGVSHPFEKVPLDKVVRSIVEVVAGIA